jgi:hypothetical protein
MNGKIRNGAAPLLLCLGLCGCANFWDDVTARSFKFRSVFTPKPDPMTVLRDSDSGDARAKALRALHEPKQNGGTDQEQDAVISILTNAATREKQPLIRLAAVVSLGHFQDPRAVQALSDAYYQAGSFTAETATVLRCQALASLGETRNPAAIDLLGRVVKEPPDEGTDEERQQARDVRFAAARALGRFHEPQAAEALVQVLKKDKDLALRDRVHESLMASTGKKIPPDPQAWEDALRGTGAEEKRPLLGVFFGN